MVDYHRVHWGGGGRVGSNNRCFILQNLGLTVANCELHDLCSFILRIMNTFSQSPGISSFQLGFYCNSYY